jgi:hypothetical protein
MVPGILHDHQITLFLTCHLWESQAAMDASQWSLFKSATGLPIRGSFFEYINSNQLDGEANFVMLPK